LKLFDVFERCTVMKFLQFSRFIYLVTGFLILSIQSSFPQGMTENHVKLGIDRLAENNFKLIENKKVALLTNNAGRNSKEELTAEVLARATNFKLTAILTPEHGFYTAVPAGDKVSDDTLFGVPTYSLYGSNRRPTAAQLSSCNIIVVDIQDIGVRSYTYISTLYKVMDAAAEYGKSVMVLDRPNPLGGIIVDGNTVDKGSESFIGIIPVSYIHGCTIGELAKMINEEGWLPDGSDGKPRKCKLTVVKMENWKRWMNWEDTGLMWFPTSPNIPTLDAVRGYGMIGAFGELGTVNIGIGTTLPFQYLGGIDFQTESTDRLLQEYDLSNGVRLFKTKFKTFFGRLGGKELQGFLIRFRISNDLRPYSDGMKAILAIRRVHPEFFNRTEVNAHSIEMFNKATGSEKILEAFFRQAPDETILSLIKKGLPEYMQIRSKYLLYD
jgi:uncharacterized protein YbbC (DUF1343 family)